jgi:hypothetical protein
VLFALLKKCFAAAEKRCGGVVPRGFSASDGIAIEACEAEEARQV